MDLQAGFDYLSEVAGSEEAVIWQFFNRFFHRNDFRSVQEFLKFLEKMCGGRTNAWRWMRDNFDVGQISDIFCGAYAYEVGGDGYYHHLTEYLHSVVTDQDHDPKFWYLFGCAWGGCLAKPDGQLTKKRHLLSCILPHPVVQEAMRLEGQSLGNAGITI